MRDTSFYMLLCKYHNNKKLDKFEMDQFYMRDT